jgi:hypothetical protein
MPRICTICSHPQRTEIDAVLIANESFQRVANRFGITKSAVLRHNRAHVAQHLAKAPQFQQPQPDPQIASASVLVDELLKLTKKTGEILARAMREKDGELALKAIARLEKQLELKGRLLGELEDRGGGGEMHVTLTYVDKMLVTPGPPASNAQRAIEASATGE